MQGSIVRLAVAGLLDCRPAWPPVVEVVCVLGGGVESGSIASPRILLLARDCLQTLVQRRCVWPAGLSGRVDSIDRMGLERGPRGTTVGRMLCT